MRTIRDIARTALAAVQKETFVDDIMVVVVVVRPVGEHVETEVVTNVASRDALSAALTYALEDSINPAIPSEREPLTQGNG